MSLAYRDSKCRNLSVTCPYQLTVYFVLKHINTARMPTISRQFIPLIYGHLGKKEYFLKVHLLYPFTSVKSCPLVIFLEIYWELYFRDHSISLKTSI